MRAWQDFADQAEIRAWRALRLASEEKVAAAIQPEEERINNLHAIAWHHAIREMG